MGVQERDLLLILTALTIQNAGYRPFFQIKAIQVHFGRLLPGKTVLQGFSHCLGCPKPASCLSCVLSFPKTLENCVT